MVKGKGRLDEPVSFPKNDDEWLSFLIASDRATHDRVKLTLQLKKYIDERPKTSATWRLIDAVDDHQAVTMEMVHFAGSWAVPDLLSNGTRQRARYVNPNYAHAHHYSDAAVRCDCGAVVVREAFSEKQEQPAQTQEHADGCNKINRHDYRAELLRNRRDIIKQMAGFGHNFRSMAPRLGYEASADNVPTVARNIGLDPHALYTEGRERAVRTMAVLLRSYTPKTVGKLFDVHPRTATTMVEEESTIDTSALYSVRRRNGATGVEVVADD